MAIINTVYKDHPWEHNMMVVVHRWSLIAVPFMQKINNWETKGMVAIDRKLLFQCGLQHRFDYVAILRGAQVNV